MTSPPSPPYLYPSRTCCKNHLNSRLIMRTQSPLLTDLFTVKKLVISLTLSLFPKIDVWHCCLLAAY